MFISGGVGLLSHTFTSDKNFQDIITELSTTFTDLTIDIYGNTDISSRKDLISFKQTDLNYIKITNASNSNELTKLFGFSVYDADAGAGDYVSIDDSDFDDVIDSYYVGAARLPYFNYIPDLNVFMGTIIGESFSEKRAGLDQKSLDGVFSTPYEALEGEIIPFQAHKDLIPSFNLFLKKLKGYNLQWKNYSNTIIYKCLLHRSNYKKVSKFDYWYVYIFNIYLLDTRGV